jgi:hypothetical protein
MCEEFGVWFYAVCRLPYFMEDLDVLEMFGGCRPWFRRLVTDLSLRRPGFNLRSVHVSFHGQSCTVTRFCSKYFGFPLSV